jgi:hypothetical protein
MVGSFVYSMLSAELEINLLTTSLILFAVILSVSLLIVFLFHRFALPLSDGYEGNKKKPPESGCKDEPVTD